MLWTWMMPPLLLHGVQHVFSFIIGWQMKTQLTKQVIPYQRLVSVWLTQLSPPQYSAEYSYCFFSILLVTRRSTSHSITTTVHCRILPIASSVSCRLLAAVPVTVSAALVLTILTLLVVVLQYPTTCSIKYSYSTCSFSIRVCRAVAARCVQQWSVSRTISMVSYILFLGWTGGGIIK